MNIAVYCGTGKGNHPVYGEEAGILGIWMAKQEHTLIFGGGNIGLMGIVARNVFENDGHVVGVLPGEIDFIAERPQPYCSETVVSSDMASRKKTIMELADAYIALPGGIGTLDEITEVMTLIKIDIIQKPIVLFNINDYYRPFEHMLRHMIQQGFMEEKDLKRVLITDRLEDIQSFLSSTASPRSKCV